MEIGNTLYEFDAEELHFAGLWLAMSYGMENGSKGAALQFAITMIEDGETDEGVTDLVNSWAGQYLDYQAEQEMKNSEAEEIAAWNNSPVHQYV